MSLEVTLHYDSRSKKSMVAFLAVWFLLWVLALLTAAAAGLKLETNSTLIFAILGGFFAFVPLTLLARVHTQIAMNELSIRVPTFLLGLFQQHHKFFWRDLDKVTLSKSKDLLRLHMKDGARISIQLKRLSAFELEKLLLAIDAWAPQCIKSSSVCELQQQFVAGAQAIPTLTQMWDAEFQRRYSPAAFIPLEPGTTLCSAAGVSASRNAMFAGATGEIKILKQLSFGGFSAIYLAERGNETVVVKELAIPESSETESRAKARVLFAREAKILGSLSHPNVVKILDCFEENGRDYVLLEYIAGPNLRQSVTVGGPLPQQRVIEIAISLVEALAFFRSQEPAVIHRDISPDNIILLDNGVKVLDFGAANEFVSTVTGTVIGKASYMAPEQVRGKAVPATDMYGLGATLHFLLSGQDPEPLSQIDEKSLDSALPLELRQLLQQMTDFDVDARPTPPELLEILQRMRESCNSPPPV